MNDKMIERLGCLDSCAVSDALDSQQISGVVFGLNQLAAKRRAVGRAITVKLGEDDGRKTKRHLGTAAVEAGDANSIIIVEHNGRTDVAGWGGILTLAASKRGIAAVIIDGASRDVDEARDLDFPIYGRAGVPRTARGRIIEHDWNVPVQISGVTVVPGDLVIADGSGVVVIPQDEAETIVKLAETIVRKEALMADAVRRGMPVSEVMGTNYEDMLKEPEA